MHTKNYIFPLPLQCNLKISQMLLNFNVVHFPFVMWTWPLMMPVNILYNSYCFDQNIDPVVLNKTHSILFLSLLAYVLF